MSADNSLKRKRSQIWNNFKLTGNEKKARCSYCSSDISITCGSLSNLSRHLKSKHPTISTTRSETQQPPINTASHHTRCEDDVQDNTPEPSQGTIATVNSTEVATGFSSTVKTVQTKQQATLGSYFSSNRPVSVKRSKELDEQLLTFIIKGFHPFSIVEEDEFKKFVHSLCPAYNLPTRKTVSSSLLLRLYNSTVQEVRSTLQEVDAVCLTTDSWTSLNNQSFNAITAHFINSEWQLRSVLLECLEMPERHTSENLCRRLKDTVHEWGLENKVVAVVTDNAANIVAAVRLCKWRHLPCFAHCVNLVVHAGISVSGIHIIINKIKGIVEFFKKSSHGLTKLHDTQKQMGLPELKLTQDVPTRWNSTLDMISRIVMVKDAVVATLAVLHTELNTLTSHEWTVAEKSIDVLQIFQDVTVEVSAEKSVPRSKVILFVKIMNKKMESLLAEQSTPTEITSMVTILREQLARRFKDLEDNELNNQATLLDPRFKRYGFSDEAKFHMAYENLKRKVCGLRITEEIPIAPVEETQTSQSSSCLWGDFDTEISKVVAVQNPVAAGIIELDRYMQQPILRRTEDPLLWWNERKEIYPRLFQLAKR
ncbi:E3 SUMO-protein ligase ZBED1-like [Pseudophryne corroboree]|uniref:E3 SUMO-protein ligase ZBED1-like n=1 Tax=Pseudophryne corroboree TaxID=495146 RepID=UPI0030818A23